MVAVKVLLSDDAGMRRAMEREAGVLALLRHPNLLLFIGFCAQPRPAILSEFMQRGRSGPECLFTRSPTSVCRLLLGILSRSL